MRAGLFDKLPQADNFFMLFKQHSQQEDLKRQRVGGVCRGREVLVGSREQVIQHQLVATPQGTPETGEGPLLLQEYLSD